MNRLHRKSDALAPGRGGSSIDLDLGPGEAATGCRCQRESLEFAEVPPREWTFITSHASLLIEVTRTPNATVRELADRSKLTERHAQRVLGDLAAAGYLERERVGRRNLYRISEDRPMRHPTVAAHTVGELLAALSH